MTMCIQYSLMVFVIGFLARQCRAEDEQPLLLYAAIDRINSIEMGTWVNMTIADSRATASVDYHYNRGLIFWADINTGITLAGTNSVLRTEETIIKVKVGMVYGITVDWIYDHIYWTDETFQNIQVANLDGLMRKSLIEYLIEKPRAIAVHPTNRMMFFSDSGSFPRIERCGLDGKDRETIIHKNIVYPNSIAIDQKAKRIFWTDGGRNEINSAKFDGSSVKTVIKNKSYLPNPFGIAVYKDKVFWTNSYYVDIFSTEKYSSYEVERVYSDTKKDILPFGLKVYHGTQQMNMGIDRCGRLNGGCSHLCLPSFPQATNTKGYRCSCPDGHILGFDGKTCSYNGRNIQLLLTEDTGILKVDLDTSSISEIMIKGKSYTLAVDYHFEKNLMFWTDGYYKNIYVYQLYGKSSSGVGMKSVLLSDNYDPTSLAVDWVYDHLYWMDYTFGEIHVSDLDGTTRKTLVEGLIKPGALSLYPNEGIMFFTDWGYLSGGRIERCSMDGTDRMTVIKEDNSKPLGLAIDYPARRIYWTDYALGTIKSSTLDGDDVYTLLELSRDSSAPTSIDILADQIYWRDHKKKGIYSAHKYRTNDQKPYITNLIDPGEFKFAARNLRPKGINRCEEANVKCSHLCLPVPFSAARLLGFTCTCADGFQEEDNIYCIRKESGTLVKEEL